MSSEQPSDNQADQSSGVGKPRDAAREAAKRRLAARARFWRTMLIWLFLIAVSVVIWLASGRGAFWPGWVIFGLLVASFWMWMSAYGPRERQPSDAEIEAEVKRQRDR